MELLFQIPLIKLIRVNYFIQVSSNIIANFFIQILSPDLINFLMLITFIGGILDFTLLPFLLVFIRKLHQQKLKKRAREAKRNITFEKRKIVTIVDGVMAGGAYDTEGCCCTIALLIIIIPIVILAYFSLIFGLLHVMAFFVVGVIPAIMIIATVKDIRNQSQTLEKVLAAPPPEPDKCPSCGTTLSFEDRFCTNCGATIRRNAKP